jgi:hypothetical protein
MAARIRVFRAAGCVVLRQPHSPADERVWIRLLDEYIEDVNALRLERPNDPRLNDPDLIHGLSWAHSAIRKPPYLVALRDNRPLAVMCYVVLAGKCIRTGLLGSTGEQDYAGTAVAYELAKMAHEARLPVDATYIQRARGFHVKICRTLDRRPELKTSEWSVADCSTLVRGIEVLL